MKEKKMWQKWTSWKVLAGGGREFLFAANFAAPVLVGKVGREEEKKRIKREK